MVKTANDQTQPRGFDFLFGDWRVADERLTSRLTGSTNSERFEAEVSCRPVLSGFGNIAYSLFPPVRGSFTDGVGEFTGTDEQDGTPVLVRHRWSDMTATRARWGQAFSTDSGATWETNWIMSFSRVRS